MGRFNFSESWVWELSQGEYPGAGGERSPISSGDARASTVVFLVYKHFQNGVTRCALKWVGG